MEKQFNWGIIGTGNIASVFAECLQPSTACRIGNVTGTSPEKARTFSQSRGLNSWSESLEGFLEDPHLDAVYIASPHSMHEAHVLACIESGKPVLCEKPLALSLAGAHRLAVAARDAGLFLMEAYMYRCSPVVEDLKTILRSGRIGTVRSVSADFGFSAVCDPDHRLFSPSLGGGGILDIGGYPVSFARLIAGLMEGKSFSEPVRFQGSGQIGPTGVDEYAESEMLFPSGMEARCRCSITSDLGTKAIITGDKGSIVIPNPWFPDDGIFGLRATFTVLSKGGGVENRGVFLEKPIYALEAEIVEGSVKSNQTTCDAMSIEDSLGNAAILEKWAAQLDK